MKIDPADKAFSMYVRLKQGKCQRCGSKVGLNTKGQPITHQLSHFQGRGKENTRFDLENCDCLCGGCHMYFTAYPAEHYLWQVKTKSQQTVDLIILRSHLYCKKDRKMARMVWQQAYKDLEKDILRG